MNEKTKTTGRVEKDSFGEVVIPDEAYYGAQTQRSLHFFPIGTQIFQREFIRAIGIVKLCAAQVNASLGKLDKSILPAIQQACLEVISGRLDDQFPLSVWQTGSGTQTNMNTNEVIASRANEILGRNRWEKSPVHPNDHVNMAQSTNDAFPTAMHIAIVEQLHACLIPVLKKLQASVVDKVKEFKEIVKIGRTHCMDATPLTLGQEFSGYAAQVEFSIAQLEKSLEGLYWLALGGTAVGTGLNSHPQYAHKVAEEIAAFTGYPFVSCPNKFFSLAAHDAVVVCSGALKSCAVALFKIANDIRLLGSGPRCGLGEINLPENEPGSSIMPGKVNPTQCEALTMVCAQVIGYDAAVTFSGTQGHFELNVYKPIMVYATLDSIRLLTDAVSCFDKYCVQGITVNKNRIDELLHRSLMLVTALSPRVGYDQATRIAKHAHKNGLSLKEAAVSMGVLSSVEFDELVKPENMIAPEV